MRQVLRERSRPLRNPDDLDLLLEKTRNTTIVMLGEASHGTSDYYTWRARISKRLIQEQGFRFVAVEGDWPDCYELNRYIKGWSEAGSAREVLQSFERWPTWMWANWEIIALAEWMRAYNGDKPDHEKIGFYGLDVYSLWESLQAVYGHLKEFHPDKLEHAMQAISCFEPFNREGQSYAWHTRLAADDCADEVIELLRNLRTAPAKYPDDPESHFSAEQNAHVTVNAERYYRAMVRADNDSWNVRDTHMMDTLDRLMHFHAPGAKGIVWEHNTHIGDARYTDMAEAGMVNIGQLAREQYGEHSGNLRETIEPSSPNSPQSPSSSASSPHRPVYLVGFGSYQGTVIAGRSWGASMEVMEVPPGQRGSWEALLHEAKPENQLLLMDEFRDVEEIEDVRGHRAIGVVYKPEYEMFGNYVPSDLSRRYDAFIFIDQTHALHPLHLEAHSGPEPPDTYPWGV